MDKVPLGSHPKLVFFIYLFNCYVSIQLKIVHFHVVASAHLSVSPKTVVSNVIDTRCKVTKSQNTYTRLDNLHVSMYNGD